MPRFILLLAFAAGLMSPPAFACVCLGRSAEDQFRSHELVFEGIPRKTYELDSASETKAFRSIATDFEVIRSIKGRHQNVRTIVKADGEDCSNTFASGRVYRVYADRYGNEIVGSACSMTRDITEEAESGSERVSKSSYNELSRDERAEKSLIRLFAGAAKSLNHKDNLTRSDLERSAWLYSRWGDWERLEDLARLAMEKWPDDPLGAEYLIDALLKQNRIIETIEPLQYLLSQDGSRVKLRSQLAQAVLARDGRLNPFHKDYTGFKYPDRLVIKGYGRSADFSGSSFGSVVANHVNFENASFAGSNIENASFVSAQLRGASLYDSNIFSGDEALGENVEKGFDNADLRGADLRSGWFESTSFIASDLRGANLTNADFKRANLKNALFEGAIIRNAVFAKAKLVDVDLSGVVVENTDFSGANLGGANLGGFDPDKIQLLGARVNCQSTPPRGTDWSDFSVVITERSCDGVQNEFDYTDQDWKDTEFSDLDLAQADFSRSSFSKARFIGTNLRNAKFTEAKVTAEFAGADLTGAIFANASLSRDVYFAASRRALRRGLEQSAAILENVDFSEAEMHTASFIGQPATPIPDISLSNSIFKAAHMKCRPFWSTLKQQASRLEYTRMQSEKEGATDSLTKKRVKRVQMQFDEEQGRYAAERNLVRMLRDKWPSMTFERCEKHFDGAGE